MVLRFLNKGGKQGNCTGILIDFKSLFYLYISELSEKRHVATFITHSLQCLNADLILFQTFAMDSE